MVAHPDRGAGNDPKPSFFFFRGVGSLSQPRLNIFTVGNMRVMICLGQGGLRSLSASSLFFFQGGGGGGGVVFHNQGSTFLQWAIYESNNLPRPRRSALSECF